MTRYIVIEKHANGAEMHVLANGNLSFYGNPKKFLTKDQALEHAKAWAQVNANCGQKNRKMLIREV